jgi:hypothetical protein
MKERIDEFEYEGKKCIYYDISHFRSNAQFRKFIACANEVIQRYPREKLIFFIINVEGVMYDSETKALIVEWLDYTRSYTWVGAMIGMDSTKRLMMNSILKVSGQDNIKFFRTRDDAMVWLAGL